MTSVSQSQSPRYTTSSVFLQTLALVGITHAFVNWGSDHPALLEDLERQRVEARAKANASQTESKADPSLLSTLTNLEIITCPNEMVALSAAQGYAQASGRPAAVLVHVDVGTQALAGAIHNVDRCRVPVLIYAGASPFSLHNELKGSRNEFIMWLQDIPDQTAIVRQYMRYTGEIRSGKNVDQVVRRALQIATSEPKGPVYLWARREVMEEEVNEETFLNVARSFNDKIWRPVEKSALSEESVHHALNLLLTTPSPLLITSYLGRNPTSVALLVSLSELLALPILASCPSYLNFPYDHPNFVGTFYGIGANKWIRGASGVVVLDADVPWIRVHNRLSSNLDSQVEGIDVSKSAGRKIIRIDTDVLKRGMNMGVDLLGGEGDEDDEEIVCEADSGIALRQILLALQSGRYTLPKEAIAARREKLRTNYEARLRVLETLGSPTVSPSPSTPATSKTDGDNSKSSISTPPPGVPPAIFRLLSTLSSHLPRNTLVLNEGISNYPFVWDFLAPSRGPGAMFTSGSSSLGWGLGAAIGMSLAARCGRALGVVRGEDDTSGTTEEIKEGWNPELIVLIVGDGSYVFGVPSAAYWIARRYDTPFLTIILNNGGWKSPKLSLLGVHPSGHGARASGNTLSVGFGPGEYVPDYAGIASAAGGAWGRKVSCVENEGVNELGGGLEIVIKEAMRVVLEERRCAVVDCAIEGF